MIGLVVTSIIDVSIVKINDLIDKYFIPIQGKLILFAINSSVCLFLQFYLVRHIHISLQIDRLNRTLKVKVIYSVSLISLSALAGLIGFLIFEQVYNGYYNTLIVVGIIALGYGTAAGFVIWLSFLFFSWYKSHHDLIVLLYFISLSVIAFNLITTAIFTGVKVNDHPDLIGEYVGSSGDLTGGRHLLLDNIYRISSFMSFLSIWITTAILMNYYREKLINAIVYWVILSIPLVYFIITYFYQYVLGNILNSFLEIDPVSVSIILGAFLALSKPIGGLLFGLVFWNISRIIGYERNIKTYMIISGWGILLIFSSNQAATQIVIPYPPFGLVTITILVVASYLMLLGIYNSATLVSANNELRRTIHRRALESKLLGAIGHAEMEKEIQKTVKQISSDKEELEKELEEPVELDELELEKYIEFVVKEVRRAHKH
ncbi:MAG TPA: hypothetical protein VE548_11705 [Nitrososphaeraceae archaeon]|jgi:hypothetical protein|nr:hypothetical protein [Nitrososphaeraceae archaeon]